MKNKLYDYIIHTMNQAERSALLCRLAGWFNDEEGISAAFWTAVEHLTMVERAVDQSEEKVTGNHTKAPWRIAHSGYSNTPFVVYAGENEPNFLTRHPLQGVNWIAEVKHDESPDAPEQIANVHLIASAPEMYSAIKKQLAGLDGDISDIHVFQNMLDAHRSLEQAIRKAEGKFLKLS